MHNLSQLNHLLKRDSRSSEITLIHYELYEESVLVFSSSEIWIAPWDFDSYVKAIPKSLPLAAISFCLLKLYHSYRISSFCFRYYSQWCLLLLPFQLKTARCSILISLNTVFMLTSCLIVQYFNEIFPLCLFIDWKKNLGFDLDSLHILICSIFFLLACAEKTYLFFVALWSWKRS